MVTSIGLMVMGVVSDDSSNRANTTSEAQKQRLPAEHEVNEDGDDNEWVGYFVLGYSFILAGGFFGGMLLWIAAITVSPFILAWNLAQRRRHNLCLAATGVGCTNIPFGTLLGVMTILVLSRESVKLSFERPFPIGDSTPGDYSERTDGASR